MKNKNIKMAIIAGIGFVASFFASTGVYAADPQITINNGSENLYVASGTKASTDGTASYDSATNTITLNNFHGDDIKVSNLESIIISLQGENTISMNTLDSNQIPQGINASGVDLNITGTGSLQVNKESFDADAYPASGRIIFAKNITIDSGSLQLSAPVGSCVRTPWAENGAGELIINSGNLELKCNDAVHAEDVIINGGKIDIDGNFTGIEAYYGKSIEINGGDLTINANPGSQPMDFKDTIINGGTVKISGGYNGISSHYVNSSFFSMKGGVLEISSADDGIRYVGSTAVIEFLGGTTIINSSNGHAVRIFDSICRDGAIVLGDDINLYPNGLSVIEKYSSLLDSYDYYLGLNGSAAKSVVITDDEDYTPEDIPVPNTAGDTSSEPNKKEKKNIGTPDTGINTKDDGFVLPVLAIIPLVVLASTVIVYLVKNKKHTVDFN